MATNVKRSQAELEILHFTVRNGRFEPWGVVSVLAARKLVAEGLIRMVEDNADPDGVGHVVVAPCGK